MSDLTVNSKITLSLQLWDLDTSKHVRATLYRPDDTVLAIKTLAHVAKGLYEDDTENMPSLTHVNAVFEVFDDAGFTKLSKNHSGAHERFNMVDQSLLQSIANSIAGVSSGLANVEVTLTESPSIIGDLAETLSITGEADNEAIEADLSGDGAIETELNENPSIEGQVNDCS